MILKIELERVSLQSANAFHIAFENRVDVAVKAYDPFPREGGTFKMHPFLAPNFKFVDACEGSLSTGVKSKRAREKMDQINVAKFDAFDGDSRA